MNEREPTRSDADRLLSRIKVPDAPACRHIVFVCYTNFLSNSAIQMFHLANALVDLGNDVTCVVPAPTSTVHNCGTPKFQVASWSDALDPSQQGTIFRNPPNVIHGWTPREGVRKVVLELCRSHKCRHMIHLEDNEDYVCAVTLGIDYDSLLDTPEQELETSVHDGLSHPLRSRQFIAESAGVTLLIERLKEFVQPPTPSMVFYPSCDEGAFYERPVDYEWRRCLGVADDDFLLTYNGNAHPANYFDMRSLYVAVGLCNQRGGRRVKLLRLGVTDQVDLYREARELIEPYVIELGSRPHSEQAPNLALADALLQPGGPDRFNDYRFPSKLPEFFRMGKPVILPRSNIGLVLEDDVDALLLSRGTVSEMVEKIDLLRNSPDRCCRLGRSIKTFADRFSWMAAAESVQRFYEQQLL